MLLNRLRSYASRLEGAIGVGNLGRVGQAIAYPYGRFLKTPLNLARNRRKSRRCLEIGPGVGRIAGFETVNVTWSPYADYVADASGKLPFAAGTFDVVYASHVLEHTPWYQLEATLGEWARILKPGGALEIWVPDGLRIAQAFVEAEGGTNYIDKDGWYRFNPRKDPCVWANGRIFSYGDGTGSKSSPLGLRSPEA